MKKQLLIDLDPIKSTEFNVINTIYLNQFLHRYK